MSHWIALPDKISVPVNKLAPTSASNEHSFQLGIKLKWGAHT